MRRFLLITDSRLPEKEIMSNNGFLTQQLFSVDSKPYGLQYAEWTVRWWRWVLSIPKDRNPLIDSTGEHCAEGQRQSGPVWFLAGTTGNIYRAERKCIIPTGKAILFPILVSQFSYAEVPSIKSNEELIATTAKDIDNWSLLEVIIDGLKLNGLQKYRVKFGPFDLSLPENNVWDITAGPTKAVSNGFWAFLKPLKDGSHTISFHGIEPHFATKVRYDITIK